jgi:DNA-binding sugar fermentation-stimulating protein
VRTTKLGSFRETVVLIRGKKGLTDLATSLRFLFTIIPRKIENWSIASRTDTIFRNVTCNTSEHGLDFLAITLLVVRKKIFPVPVLLEVINSW